MGECEYGLFTNNREHFANECAEGRAHRALSDTLACRAVWEWLQGRGWG